MHIVADLYAEVIGVLAQAKWVDRTQTKSDTPCMLTQLSTCKKFGEPQAFLAPSS